MAESFKFAKTVLVLGLFACDADRAAPGILSDAAVRLDASADGATDDDGGPSFDAAGLDAGPFDEDAGGSVDAGVLCSINGLFSEVGSNIATGDTRDADDLLSPTCVASASPERILSWVAPTAGVFAIRVESDDFNTVLYVTEGAMCGGIELACNDDAVIPAPASFASEASLVFQTGSEVLIVVDGKEAAAGTFSLSIVAVPE